MLSGDSKGAGIDELLVLRNEKRSHKLDRRVMTFMRTVKVFSVFLPSLPRPCCKFALSDSFQCFQGADE